MNTDETIRQSIEKAAEEARYLLRSAAEESPSDNAAQGTSDGESPYIERRRSEIINRIELYSSIDNGSEWRRFKRSRLGKANRRVRARWLVAAAIVLFAVSATFVLLSRHADDNKPQYALFDSKTVRPGSRTALLTVGEETFRLAAGSKMEIMPAQIRLTDSHGHAQRVLPASANGRTTLSVPRGGEYSLTLPDGTKVWLNASSRITFPTRFNQNERRISLEGEAYFEVAKSEGKPFYVSVGTLQVHVTGTVFNVKAHPGKDVEVALVSGAVQIESQDNRLLASLQAGQGFCGAADGSSFSVNEADMDIALAWHNGLFVFKDEPLANIAEQLSLWYNIDITVPNELAGRCYSGELDRYRSIEPLLKVLRLTGEMEFLDRGKGKMEIIQRTK